MGASCKPAPSALHQVATARAGAGTGERWRCAWPPTKALGLLLVALRPGLWQGEDAVVWEQAQILGNRQILPKIALYDSLLAAELMGAARLLRCVSTTHLRGLCRHLKRANRLDLPPKKCKNGYL